MGPSRDDAMLPAIDETLRAAGLQARDVRAIVCGAGPGSFTSLRIAASLAKGFAVANDAALIAVPSLLLAAVQLVATPGRYVLHADALRGERYVQDVCIDANGACDVPGPTTRMDAGRFSEYEVAMRTQCAFVAIDARASRANVETDTPVRTVVPDARDAAAALSCFPSFGSVDVATWEPDYGRLAEAQVKWEQAHGHALPGS